MGITTVHALGQQQFAYFNTEAVAKTMDSPFAAGADAAKITKVTIGYQPDRKNRNVNQSTRSTLERVTGKVQIPISVEAEIVPSGAAGTPPDLHPLFLSALPSYTNTESTSDVYTVSDSQTLSTFTAHRVLKGTGTAPSGAANIAAETAWGCVIDSMTISLSGGGIPTVKFDGQAMGGYAHTGSTALAATEPLSETELSVTAGTAKNFSIGSKLQVGSSTIYTVTAVNTSTDYLTITPGLSGEQASGVAVFPVSFTPTTAGSTLMGISGSCTVDGTAIPIIGAEISVKNNLKFTDNEALTQLPSDAIVGMREITGKIDFHARQDLLKYMWERRLYSTHAITLVVGSVAGSIMTASIPYAEWGFADWDVPISDAVTISLPFTALGSSGADEFTLTFS